MDAPLSSPHAPEASAPPNAGPYRAPAVPSIEEQLADLHRRLQTVEARQEDDRGPVLVTESITLRAFLLATVFAVGAVVGSALQACGAQAQPSPEGVSDPESPDSTGAVRRADSQIGAALGRGLGGGHELGAAATTGSASGTSSPTLVPALDPAAVLALAVAKVAANEASLDASREDVALIWQVTEGRARTHDRRLAWLERHSSCVLTDRSLRPREHRTNCLWTRGLKDDDSQPEGWPTRWGPWERYVDRWRRIRVYALRLVRGEHRLRPCAETPTTWGGPMDRAQAVARGLRTVVCVGTRNDGWVRAR